MKNSVISFNPITDMPSINTNWNDLDRQEFRQLLEGWRIYDELAEQQAFLDMTSKSSTTDLNLQLRIAS